MTTPFGSDATRAAMRDTLGRIADVRLGVIGDMVVDRFVHGLSTRISREAPVLILRHKETTEVPGGGANTVANVCALGATATAIGVVGDDANGETMRRMLARAGVDEADQRLHIRAGWPTTTKTRILGGLNHSTLQQIVRVDHEEELPADPAMTAALVAELEAAWPALDACIVCDYGIGVVQEPLVAALHRLRKDRPIPVLVDSRYALPVFAGLTSMTPNISEVEATLGDDTLSGDVARIEVAGTQLREDLSLDALLVTRGKFGMALFERGRTPLHIPVFGSDQVADVTGAGDTVIATYSSALATGASFELAARLANVAGGLVVMKRGTATAGTDEVRRALG